MMNILLAVDGSESAQHAVAHLIKRASAAKDDYRVHLVNVQYPLHGGVSSFINTAQLKHYHHEEGMKILAPARAMLEAAGIHHDVHLFVGEPAEVIARFGKEQGCDEIIIGTRGLSAISGMLVGSVALK